MGDDKAERARTAIEDAVYRALGAGLTAADIRAEIDYVLENVEE